MKTEEKSQSQNLTKAAEVLKSGGVVIFPTDTVYGIGCVSSNKNAINRIYKIKGTAKSQHFPVLVSNIAQIEEITKIDPNVKKLMQKHWPGALTVIIRVKDKKIGFRMPDSPLAQALINEVKKPIIGTSANFHTHKTPNSFQDLDPDLVKLADFALEGICKLGIESTVVDTTFNPPKILRQGAVNL